MCRSLSRPIASWTLPASRRRPCATRAWSLREIRQQPLLVGIADRPILVDARLAPAEDVYLGPDHLPLDDHAQLLLPRVAGGRDADHFRPVRLVGERVLVGPAFRVARGHEVVMPARPDLGQVLRERHAPVDHDRGPAPAPRSPTRTRWCSRRSSRAGAGRPSARQAPGPPAGGRGRDRTGTRASVSCACRGGCRRRAGCAPARSAGGPGRPGPARTRRRPPHGPSGRRLGLPLASAHCRAFSHRPPRSAW